MGLWHRAPAEELRDAMGSGLVFVLSDEFSALCV